MFDKNKFISESQLEMEIEQKVTRTFVKPLPTTDLPFQAADPTTTQVYSIIVSKLSHEPQDRLHQSTRTSATTSNTLPGSSPKHNRLPEDAKERRNCIPPCRNGGTCNTAAGACVCAAGFRGRYCQLDRNECVEGDKPCGVHLCVNAWGSYRCLCPAGYRASAGGTSCAPENAWRDLRVANMVVEEQQPNPPVLSSAGNMMAVQHVSTTTERGETGTKVTVVSPEVETLEVSVEDSVKSGNTQPENGAGGSISNSSVNISGSYSASLKDSTNQFLSMLSGTPTYSIPLYTNSGSRATTFASTSRATKGAAHRSSTDSITPVKEPTKTTTPADFSQDITYTIAPVPTLFEQRFRTVSSVGLVKDMKSPTGSAQEFIPGEYTHSTKLNANMHNSVPFLYSGSNKSSENSDVSRSREHLAVRNFSDPGIQVNLSDVDRKSSSSTMSHGYWNLSSYEPISVTSDGRHLNASLKQTLFGSEKNNSVNKASIQSHKSAEHDLTEKDSSGGVQKATVSYVAENSTSTSNVRAVLSTTEKIIPHTNHTLGQHSRLGTLFSTLPSPDSEARDLFVLPTVAENMKVVTEEQDTPELKKDTQQIQRPDEMKFKTIKNKKVRSSVEKRKNKQRNSLEERSGGMGRGRMAASRPPGSRMFLLEPLPTPAPTAAGTLPPLPTIRAPPKPGADCFFKYRRIPSGQSFYKDATNCTSCVCQDSEVRCEKRQCPAGPLRCEQPVSGRCCRHCPHDCVLESGDVLLPGETWTSALDPCRVCRCVPNGRVECSPVECAVQCYHPRLTPGECCPACRGCQYGTRTYDDGQLFPHPSQPCTTCVCQQGNITCYPEACPAAGCSHPLPAPSPSGGGCCPRCLHCLLEGQRLLHATSILLLAADATCRNCSCRYGNVSCSPAPCEAAPGCRLESGAEVPLGSQFWPAEDACTVCRCSEGGRALCRSADCPGPPCTHGVLLPDSCCLDCSKCDYRGELFDEQQEFLLEAEPCQRCHCVGGNVTCQHACGGSSAVRLPGD